VRGEQASIRTRLEALNRLASHVSRSLHARDRAEAVAMTLRRDFGALGVQVWLPEADRGWVCIELADDHPLEYRLYSRLPDPLQAAVAAKEPEEQIAEGDGEVTWTSPLFRAERVSVLLRIRFSADQWTAAVPLLSSINRFCVNAFEISRVHEEVSTERQRLDAILNSTGEGVLVVDREGKVALANPAAVHTLRLKHRPVMGLPLDEVLREEKYAALRQFIQTPPKAARAPEESGALPLGERFLTATRAPVQDRGVEGVVVVIRDVTQQVEVDRMKSEFISIVSHELRTPLTSIKGSLGLLLGGAGGDLPEKIKGLLGIAQSNTDRLIRLINDILDISKIEAGRVELSREPLDLRETIRAAVKSLEGMAKPVKVRLKVAVPKEKLMVMGDADRLSQVIVNLVSNAIKFSPIGSTVEVSAEQHHHVIEVNVTDEGAGIPMEHQAKLFTKFYQVDSSSSRAKSGTGLGLAISNALVKEHSGLMGVESLEGKGSRFWFTLPAFRSGSPEQPEERPYVLIGSDDPRLRRSAAELLERHDYLCVPAKTSEFPLRLKQGEYDLVLADLPRDGRGGRVLEILGEREETRGLPVGFMVPGGKGEGAPPRRVAGWLYRTMDEGRFQDTLRHMLKFGRRKSDELSVAPLVLVAHDDPEMLQGLASAVLATGLRVLRASGTEEAMETLEGESPDAVVLDVALNGLGEAESAVAALRQDRPVPVLFVAARDLLGGGAGGDDGSPDSRPLEEQRVMADSLTRLFREGGEPGREEKPATVSGGERK
jgi:PAS domain S-box-containing protein